MICFVIYEVNIYVSKHKSNDLGWFLWKFFMIWAEFLHTDPDPTDRNETDPNGSATLVWHIHIQIHNRLICTSFILIFPQVKYAGFDECDVWFQRDSGGWAPVRHVERRLRNQRSSRHTGVPGGDGARQSCSQTLNAGTSSNRHYESYEYIFLTYLLVREKYNRPAYWIFQAFWNEMALILFLKSP